MAFTICPHCMGTTPEWKNECRHCGQYMDAAKEIADLKKQVALLKLSHTEKVAELENKLNKMP